MVSILLQQIYEPSPQPLPRTYVCWICTRLLHRSSVSMLSPVDGPKSEQDYSHIAEMTIWRLFADEAAYAEC